MKTILITGSSGFVGSFLKKKLVKKYKVFGIDIVNDNFKDTNYMFFKYDISKEDILKKLR